MQQKHSFHHLGQAVRGALLFMAISSTTLVHIAQAEDNTTQAALSYQIKAGPLEQALSEFASAAGVSITLPPALVNGKTSQGLNGRYGIQQGVDTLLAGTGLQAVESNKGIFVLQKAKTLLNDKSGAASTLPEVSVSSRAERSAVTEGTGSYNAKAVAIGKTEQTLREIPQSVSVMTRQQMNDQNFTTVAEALNQMTGVRSYGYERDESFVIRGYNANTQFNGVPQQGSSGHYDLALYDRVEVLRGPSGLLTGSGEPGGTINYVLKRPQDALTMSAVAGLGSWNQQRAEFDVGGPLNADGSLRGRTVMVYQDQDKFYDVGSNRDKLLYGVLEYDLTPNTTVGLWASYADRSYKTFWGLPTYTDGSLPGRRSTFVGIDKNAEDEGKNISLDLKHKFDSGWVAKGVYNYKNTEYTGFGVFSLTPVNIATGLSNTVQVGFIETETTWRSMDFNLIGPVELFGRTHTLTVGYNKSENDYLGGSNYMSASNRDPLRNHHWDDVLNRNILSKSQTYTEQSGIYASARIKLLDPLSVILGGRWSDYSSKDRTGWPSSSKTAWEKSDANTNNEFTPYGGLVWDINQQFTWYASYADTFVPQTERNLNDRVLDPRVGWQIETGLKGEFLDGRLNTSVALFRIRDKNRAMQDTSVAGCTTSTGDCYRQAGEVQSQGLEFEVAGQPSSNLNLSVGYTYNHAQYLSDESVSSGTRFEANRMPRHMLKFWSQYRFDGSTLSGALQGLSVGAGVQAQSEIYTTTAHQGSYAITSAKLGYEINKHWDASLTVNNLFDRKYLQYPGSTYYFNIYGTPRNALLMVRWKY
ncbi:TonB-dependent receptor [Methylobacillus gramineus]|uniref:TonB-dependent siderophore receptor n=1 Tax=Methylobacillus gramineus TaxID=755169 RepID=UPI001CFF71B9|nr:TonB-dependent receptor [Methylobacillus gramineus]MCB5185476.1 TonB-dependent receptor [Methylobacillus gramineus]